jgi:archaeosine-15-forming tRNA-guanine transglycosylase
MSTKNLEIGDIVEYKWACGKHNANRRLLFLKHLTTRIRCINSKGLVVLVDNESELTKVGHMDLYRTLFKDFRKGMSNE